MVSRRNFLSIAIIMFVLFVMFQFTGVAKESWNEYGINNYAVETQTNLTKQDAYTDTGKVNGDYVIYIGDLEDGDVGSVVNQWCTYTKREVQSYTSLAEYQLDETNNPEVILLDSHYMNWDMDVSMLQKLVDENVNLIFCNLPDTQIIAEHEELIEMLGITLINADQVQLEGIKLFDGFLLGGEQQYIVEDNENLEQQDMDLEVPWYCTSAGVKVYMVGMLDEEKYADIKNEFWPSIIWRSDVGKTRIFAVNGDYLSGNTGIGILDAMMSEMHDYEIYPVVNAQTIVALNYPGLTSENAAEMNTRYSRSQTAVFRDIVWPGLVSLTNAMNAKITCMMSPQFDYSDAQEPDADELEYYLKMVSEQSGEVGLTATTVSDTSLEKKLSKDYTFLHKQVPDYEFLSFYTGSSDTKAAVGQLNTDMMQSVRTLLVDYDVHNPVISYATSDVTALRATEDGFSHTYSEDLRMRSLETALGYSTITADMQRVLYPDNSDDEWENLYEKLSSYTITYWKPFSTFEQTTLAESDERAREFLAMDYEDSRVDDTITLNIQHADQETWFILRTHGESISAVKGGSYEEIEEGAYLITAEQSEVSIQLKNDIELYYYNN